MPLKCRIATFNIENFGAQTHDRALFESRLRVLRARLLLIEADVLCLQEVNGERLAGGGRRAFPALNALLEDTPYADFHGSTTVRPGGDEPADVHNLVTLSRWKIAKARQVFHDFVPRIDWRRPPVSPGDMEEVLNVEWERPILHTAIEFAPGRLLDIVNVHFRAPRAAFIAGLKTQARWGSAAAWAEGLFLAGMKRDGQALEARLLVEEIFDERPDALLAVCGDYNAEMRDMPTRILAAGVEDSEHSFLFGEELTAIEARIPADRRYSVKHDGRCLLPDHILASEKLASACRSAAILNDGLDDEAHPAEPIVQSLHAPLVAEFMLPD